MEENEITPRVAYNILTPLFFRDPPSFDDVPDPVVVLRNMANMARGPDVYPAPLTEKEELFVYKFLQVKHRTFSRRLFEVLGDKEELRMHTFESAPMADFEEPKVHTVNFTEDGLGLNGCKRIFRLECDQMILYIQAERPDVDRGTLYQRIVWDRRQGRITCVDLYNRWYSRVGVPSAIPLLERLMARVRERRARVVQKAVWQYLPLELAVTVAQFFR